MTSPSASSSHLLSLLALAGSSTTSLAEELASATFSRSRCLDASCAQLRDSSLYSALRVRPIGLRHRQSSKGSLQVRLQGLASTTALRLRGGSQQALESLKVPLAFLGWYLMSIVYSCVNKEVLNVWKFPCVFSAVQLLVGALWIGLLWTPLPTFGMRKRRFAPLREPPRLTWSELATVSSVAVWLALGHVLSTVAPAYGTVAFTNVVKTLEPLFTCLFSAVVLKQIFSLPVYLSLLPVILGVALASASEVSFSTVSLVSGLLSNVCFALRAISAKKLMSRPVGENMHAQNLYAVLTMVALAAITPLAIAAEGGSIVAGTRATISAIGLPRFVRMLLVAGVSHYTYNECAFLALSSIHPVTHAVANTIKRVAVIVISVLYFHNPLTPTGVIGSAIAIAGVLLYSLAKAQADAPAAAKLAKPAKPPPSVIAAAPMRHRPSTKQKLSRR
jgi:solute carrier family 35 protein E1